MHAKDMWVDQGNYFSIFFLCDVYYHVSHLHRNRCCCWYFFWFQGKALMKWHSPPYLCVFCVCVCVGVYLEIDTLNCTRNWNAALCDGWWHRNKMSTNFSFLLYTICQCETESIDEATWCLLLNQILFFQINVRKIHHRHHLRHADWSSHSKIHCKRSYFDVFDLFLHFICMWLNIWNKLFFKFIYQMLQKITERVVGNRNDEWNEAHYHICDCMYTKSSCRSCKMKMKEWHCARISSTKKIIEILDFYGSKEYFTCNNSKSMKKQLTDGQKLTMFTHFSNSIQNAQQTHRNDTSNVVNFMWRYIFLKWKSLCVWL